MIKLPAYVKTIVAVVGALAATAAVVISDGVVEPGEWWTVAIAVLTALGVNRLPNAPLDDA